MARKVACFLDAHARKATFFNMAIIEALLPKFIKTNDATSGNGGILRKSAFPTPTPTGSRCQLTYVGSTWWHQSHQGKDK